MTHAPETLIKRLQLVYIVFAALVLVGYLLTKYVPGLVWLQPFAGVTDITAFFAASTIIHGVLSNRPAFKQSPWTNTFITYLLITLTFLFGTTTTGEYTSFFMYFIGIIAFLGSMLGIFAVIVPFLVHIFGIMLIPMGLIVIGSNNMNIATAIAVNWTLAVVGWLYWRRSYAKDEKSDVLLGDLRDEKQKSTIILNAIEDGVVLIDADGNIQLLNPGAAKITGWSAKEAIGLDYKSVIKQVSEHDEPYTDQQNPFVKAIRNKKTARDNKGVLVSRSDKKIPISIIVSPLLDESEEIDWIVAIFRDVTKERDEERQRAEFISTASHEMRTPVAAIEGYLALAMNERVSTIDQRAKDYLEKAHASTQQLGKLFQDLLTSAKAEDGRLVNNPEVIEMGAFLEQLTENLRFSAEKKGLLTEFTIGASGNTRKAVSGDKVVRPLYYVNADPERIREVMTNLFDNAVKYTDKGKISIGLTGNDAVVQLYVQDTGEGIPAEDIPHLFQKFYRVDTSATRTIGGTGLGLFISRKILELYNGRIWVESKLKHGSTFYINLPRLTTKKAEELKDAQAKSKSA